MKLKPTMTISVCVLAAGLAAAQSPISVIQNTRTTMNGVRDNATAASNAALGIGDKAPSAASPTQAPAKPSVTPVAAQTSATSSSSMNSSKPAKVAVSKANPGKPVKGTAAKKSAHPKAAAAPSPKKGEPVATAAAGNTASAAAAEKKAGDEPDAPNPKWSGKRDPFISPVVSRANTNSACSTGKKCLEIGAINLRGIVHAESGFIAVVSNSLNKAYFLRENDPVFNGYVVKITGDSIVFQETLQDRLGKTFTREVVKKITTPSV